MRFVCAVACTGDLVPLLAVFYVIVCLYYHLFISSVDGHLGCFWPEAIVNKTAVNLSVNTIFVYGFLFLFDM